jgi:DNA invertase Pin-like site-specific DNA recombinase
MKAKCAIYYRISTEQQKLDEGRTELWDIDTIKSKKARLDRDSIS